MGRFQPEGTLGVALCLADAGGGLFAGGDFPGEDKIVRWDGASWNPVGMGLGGGQNPGVYAMVLHNGCLIAGGTFLQSGAALVNHITRWDGAAWQPLGLGVGGGDPLGGGVAALISFDGSLIVGGNFTTAGGKPAQHIARWSD